MTESKKDILFEKLPKILQEYEVQGITKNELCRVLSKEGIATRNTFYHHSEDLIKHGIIEIRKVGKQQEKCFPTQKNQVLSKLKDKLQAVTHLLQLIENDPIIGDCFASNKSFKSLPILSGSKVSKLFKTRSQDRFFDIIDTDKPSPNGYYPKMYVYSLSARREILNELPSFLIHYVNYPNHNYSISVKNEFLKMISPIVMKSLEIMQRDYTESFSYSNTFKKELRKLLPPNEYALVYTIEKYPSPDLLLEFLKILGRFYFCTLQLNDQQSNKSKQVLSLFIETFYKDLKPQGQLEQYLKEQKIEDRVEKGVIPQDLLEEHSYLQKIQNSITWKLIDPLVVNRDPEIVTDTYMQFFIELDLFSKTEKKILRKNLNH